MVTVVLAEDDFDIAEVAQLVLEDEGHTVLRASSGREALRHCVESVPDVLLLDVTMPGDMDGWDVARTVRNDPRCSAIKIVLMTGAPWAASDRRASELGLAGLLRKPFTTDDLAAAVRRATLLAN